MPRTGTPAIDSTIAASSAASHVSAFPGDPIEAGAIDASISGGAASEGSTIAAIAAVDQHAIAPPHIARNASRERSARRDGASAPSPPIWIAIAGRFAKPHSA